tara:strand:- start:588 stop:923 length:336 start_codon:yes stop_codon:yes gene_type:complete
MVCVKLRLGQTLLGVEEFLVRANARFPAMISLYSIAPVLKVLNRPAMRAVVKFNSAGLHFLGFSEHWSAAKARRSLGTNPWLASELQPGTHVSDERQSAGHIKLTLPASHG